MLDQHADEADVALEVRLEQEIRAPGDEIAADVFGRHQLDAIPIDGIDERGIQGTANRVSEHVEAGEDGFEEAIVRRSMVCHATNRDDGSDLSRICP